MTDFIQKKRPQWYRDIAVLWTYDAFTYAYDQTRVRLMLFNPFIINIIIVIYRVANERYTQIGV